MRTVHAAETAVSILFTGEAPPARRRMLELVRGALAEAGLPLWEEMEADCFQAGGDVLLLARPGRGRRYFRFGDLESLLAGVGSCSGGGGSLYRGEAGYILAVPPEMAGAGLYEFGERSALCPAWEIHAREQENCLLADNAMDELRRVFST